MESELISVIIPMYNVKPYIERCIRSVVTGDYQNVEIICIDDGSTDDTAAVVQEMQKTDPRIRLLRQTNLGVSAARNNGLKAAAGEYIAFIDADDWVSKDYLQLMYEIAINKKADIVNCGFYGVTKRNIINQTSDHSDYQLIKIAEKDKYREIVNHVWRALYRKQLCPLFNENVRIGEDQLFNIRILSEQPVLQAWKCTKRMYFHFWHSDSLFSKAGIDRYAYICQAILHEMESLATSKYGAVGAVRQALGYRYCVESQRNNEYRDHANAFNEKSSQGDAEKQRCPIDRKAQAFALYLFRKAIQNVQAEQVRGV